MVMSHVTAQNGGFNVKNVNASENVIVGSQPGYHTEISDRSISLQVLAKTEINALTPQEGMLVYDTDSDILRFYDGVIWKGYVYLEPVVPCESIFRDQNGNIFLGVQIGTQCWMDRNMKATHYPNGEVIPYITINNEWVLLEDNNTDDAYCYYDNNPNSEYGALYTYSAAIADDWARDNTDGQGICPDGWHFPTDAEWTVLTSYLGGNHATFRLLESGFAHWNSDNVSSNDSWFTALPGGLRRDSDGVFFGITDIGVWSSATEYDVSTQVWNRRLVSGNPQVWRVHYNKSDGYSVRCLRDY